MKNFFLNFAGKDNIKAKTAQGSFWLGIGSGFEQVLRFGRNMILTRLLAPEVFGLMAIVLSVNMAFESFTQVGIKEAVIQNKNGNQSDYLNCAWWVSAIRAAGLYLVAYIGSPLIADFYDNGELASLMRVAFLGLLFNGLMSPNSYVLQKEMRFGRWATILNGGGALGIMLTIIMALFLRNIWALVIGFTSEYAIRCLLSYLLAPYKPNLKISRDELKALLRYARGMLGLPILTFIFMKCDIFVIGKMLDMKKLGLYSMVSIVAWFPFQFITMIVSQVMMPVFSKKRDEKEWINRWIVMVTKIIVSIGMPIIIFCIFYGEDFIYLIYGTEYAKASGPFIIILSTAFFRTCSVPIATFFLAIGNPEFHRLFTAVRAILVVLMIYPAILIFGLYGAAGAGLSAMLISYIFQLRKLKRITAISIRDYLNTFLTGSAFSLIIVAISATSKGIFSASAVPILNIVPGVIGCVIVYIILAKKLYREQKSVQ